MLLTVSLRVIAVNIRGLFVTSLLCCDAFPPLCLQCVIKKDLAGHLSVPLFCWLFRLVEVRTERVCSVSVTA